MADVVQSNSAAHRCHGDGPTSTAGTGNRQKRPSTREKIAKMVADGAVNYPAYLKLIYTGDSEQEPSSSEDEFSVPTRVPASAANRAETRDIRWQRPTGDGDRSRLSTEQSQPQQSQRQHQQPRSSPESDKLMDDGREKQSTSAVGSPIDCHGTCLVDKSNKWWPLLGTAARAFLRCNLLFTPIIHVTDRRSGCEFILNPRKRDKETAL
jgi:hypothetical protein